MAMAFNFFKITLIATSFVLLVYSTILLDSVSYTMGEVRREVKTDAPFQLIYELTSSAQNSVSTARNLILICILALVIMAILPRFLKRQKKRE